MTPRAGLAHGRLGGTKSAALGAGVALIVTGALGLALSRGGGTAARPAAAPVAMQVPGAVRGPGAVQGPDAPDGPGALGHPAAAVSWPTATRPVALPVELTVPAIGVRTRLIRLGLTPAGTLQVPASFSVAGWYDRSPRPGATGPAIIAGHIDSVTGPAVFYRLSSLRPGDRAYVRRADGTLAVFRVTAVRLYPKDRFPTGTVYGSAPGPELRLITCGGTFDPAIHSYLSNTVVYAVSVG